MRLNCSLTNSRTNLTEMSSVTPTPDTPEILNTLLNILPTTAANKEESKETKSHEVKKETKDKKFNDCMYESKQQVEQTEIESEEKDSLKEILKLRVRRKRKVSDFEAPHEDGFIQERANIQGLTWDDEMRRQRRRERNKVAATKCRNKKKERTTRLIAEGEVLEIQNECLREELMRLEMEEKRLQSMLAQHLPSCDKEITSEDSPPCKKSCFHEAIASNNNNNSYHNNNNVFTDCKYKIKEEEGFYENDNSISDASPFNEEVHLDDFSESYGAEKVKEYQQQTQKQYWYHPHTWHQRQYFTTGQQVGIGECQNPQYPWQFDYECMTL